MRIDNVPLCEIANRETGSPRSSQPNTWIPVEMKAYDYVKLKTVYDKLFIKRINNFSSIDLNNLISQPLTS
jgi:hypothetical protein